MVKRKIATALIAGIAGVTLAGPAYAEGSRTTYIDGWSVSKESKRWPDANVDNNSTIVDFRNCKAPLLPGGGSGASAHISLRKDVFGPDPNYGQKSSACSSTANWGNPGKGNFYFTLDRINGEKMGAFSADPVYIKW
jgi:hypothetical protein